MTPLEERYERGWAVCARCGTRRPVKQLGAEQVKGVLQDVCLDSTWCAKMIAEQKRERGRGEPADPEENPAAPRQQLLPFDDD